MADRRCGTCIYFEPARDKAGRANPKTFGGCRIAEKVLDRALALLPECVGVYATSIGVCWPDSGTKCTRWQGGRDRNVGKPKEKP